MAKLKNKSIDAVLDELRRFITYLHKVEESSSNIHQEIGYYNRDYGGISLSGDEAKRYRDCIESIFEISDLKVNSKQALDYKVKYAIVASLDIKEKEPASEFEVKLEKQISRLHKDFSAKPTRYRVSYPINGVSKESLPVTIGKVKIQEYDDNSLNEMLNHPANIDLGIERMNRRKKGLFEPLARDHLLSRVVCVTSVKAKDEKAATEIALERFRLTIDIINFYSDLRQHNLGFAYFSGEAESTDTCYQLLNESEDYFIHINRQAVGPLLPISMGDIIKWDRDAELGFREVCRFMRVDQNKLQRQISSSIQLAGKATKEQNNGQSFLLYMIAMESLFLLDSERDELTFRLRTRIAHLLGNTFEARKKISNDIKRLYDIRSTIVHNGIFDVTDLDLQLARYYSKNCIVALIIDPQYKEMKSVDSLVEHFNNMNLRR